MPSGRRAAPAPRSGGEPGWPPTAHRGAGKKLRSSRPSTRYLLTTRRDDVRSELLPVVFTLILGLTPCLGRGSPRPAGWRRHILCLRCPRSLIALCAALLIGPRRRGMLINTSPGCSTDDGNAAGTASRVHLWCCGTNTFLGCTRSTLMTMPMSNCRWRCPGCTN